MNKKVLALILFVIGISSVILSFVLSSDTKNNDQPNIDSNPEIKEPENETIEPEFALTIDKFIVKKNNSNEINIYVDVLNDTSEKITSKSLYLKFYQDDNLLYTFIYEIKEMEDGDTITIESVLNFPYDDITKYEFEYEDVKTSVTPTIE